MHSGDHLANVQDIGVKRAHSRVHPISSLLGRYQAERHAGHSSRVPISCQLSVYFQVEGEVLVEGELGE